MKITAENAIMVSGPRNKRRIAVISIRTAHERGAVLEYVSMIRLTLPEARTLARQLNAAISKHARNRAHAARIRRRMRR